MPQSQVWIVRFVIHKLLSPACLHLKLFSLKTRVPNWIVFRASRNRFAVNQFRTRGPNITVTGFFNTQAKIGLIECNLTCFQNESETAIESEVEKCLQTGLGVSWPMALCGRWLLLYSMRHSSMSCRAWRIDMSQCSFRRFPSKLRCRHAAAACLVSGCRSSLDFGEFRSLT